MQLYYIEFFIEMYDRWYPTHYLKGYIVCLESTLLEGSSQIEEGNDYFGTLRKLVEEQYAHNRGRLKNYFMFYELWHH